MGNSRRRALLLQVTTALRLLPRLLELPVALPLHLSPLAVFMLALWTRARPLLTLLPSNQRLQQLTVVNLLSNCSVQ